METFSPKQLQVRLGGSMSSIYQRIKKGEFEGAYQDSTGHWHVPVESVPRRTWGMTISEAARYWDVSRQTIYNRIDRGELTFVIDSTGRVRIPKEQ